jgi:hypothetical protein
MTESAKKTCFVIAPIGLAGSKERLHSDDVLDLIINPVITQLGFEPGRRADHLGTPGDINRQVIERIINDDLVIADLTGHNANVFYELAIRHSVRKRCIHLMRSGEKIPFDNSLQRTIFVDPEKPREIEKAKVELRVQVVACMQPDFVVENPLSVTLNYARLNEGDPTQRSIATLMKQVAWLVEQEKLRTRQQLTSGAAARPLLNEARRLIDHSKVRTTKETTAAAAKTAGTAATVARAALEEEIALEDEDLHLDEDEAVTHIQDARHSGK